MKTLALVLMWFVLSAGAFAQAPATLMEGIGDLHHPVSTRNAEAQKFFDQGLRLIYAFNHDEAARSFRRAGEVDPKLAMAYWGVAEAVGPNYNDPASEERFKQAHEAIAKAESLSSSASPAEQAYIHAMAQRFPADPKADLRAAAEQYHGAMRDLAKNYPDDLDAATLFAESGMNLHPWGLWKHDGSPEVGTDEVVATLESVLKRDPNHMGAVHYYIHAVEASPNPARAAAQADRLASLAPGAGHLVHMPAHIYIRTGDYDAALRTNLKAAAVDRSYLAASGAQGIYPMMYYSHNLHFIAISGSMTGDYAAAKQAADQLAANVAPHAKEMPPLQAFMSIPYAVQVRFHRWDEILATPQPDAALKSVNVMWHYARGMALSGKGKLEQANTEHQALAQAIAATPADEVFSMPVNNKSRDVLTIADDILQAEIAVAKRDHASATDLLRKAVALQDSLNYGEPPDWYFPVRESLGGVLLMSGNNAEAEKVFREDLDRNPRNPRSLLGLRESLKRQNRGYDAQFVDKQFQAAWKGGALRVEDLV
jgi:tetratricopeptide (TPR) repeat protein